MDLKISGFEAFYSHTHLNYFCKGGIVFSGTTDNVQGLFLAPYSGMSPGGAHGDQMGCQ